MHEDEEEYILFIRPKAALLLFTLRRRTYMEKKRQPVMMESEKMQTNLPMCLSPGSPPDLPESIHMR